MIYSILLFSIISFFVGGIPFGLLIGKAVKKIDIREHGSGNIGATNVARVIGFKYAVLTFILDGLKSFLPVFIAKQYYGFYGIEFASFIAFFSVIGHIYSPWLKGKGGKGVSSTMFVLLAIDYRLFLVMSLSWLLCFKLTKISSLSALISIILVLITSYFLTNIFSFYMISIIAFAVFMAHKKNIVKIIKGEELGFKKNK